MIHRIRSIRFELSGECCLKEEHSFCPASKLSKGMLSATTIMKVIRILPSDFSGDIGFHNYNEPLMDPRLLWLVCMIKIYLHKAKITVWTNGVFLTKEIIEDCKDAGVDEIIATAYNPEIEKFHSEFVKVSEPNIDSRLENYSREVGNTNTPCDAPFGQLLINRFGYVSLCCMDWKNSITFGNLRYKELPDCFPAMDEVYKNLIEGKRYMYDVCSRCNRTRIKAK